MAPNLMPIVPTTTAALDPVTDSPVRKLRQHLRSGEFGAATLEVKKGAVRCRPASMPLLHHPGIIRELLGKHDLVLFGAIA